MLSERELEQSAAQLDEFSQANNQHQDLLSQVLEKYSSLMEDYKRLTSDYEEERISRERYKQLAREQERHPFVLVLVDGDGYIFDDNLVSTGAEGGQRAAGLLDQAIKGSLRERGLGHCRIIVRVYANLVHLSKRLSFAKLVGSEKRSLTPFTASFTGSGDHFDFVDAGESKENAAQSKVRALFRLYAENTQCRHIYFAGCHNVDYLDDLTPHASNRNRITLVHNPAMHPGFDKLGLEIEDFPGVFRTLPLESQPFIHKAPSTGTQPRPQNASVCVFDQRGKCKYGKTCRDLHGDTNGRSRTPNAGVRDLKSWRADDNDSSAKLYQPPYRSESDTDSISVNVHSNGVQSAIDLATLLPRTVPQGKIPINKKGYRLDVYVPEPTAEAKGAFEERSARQKLCKNLHLTGNCPRRKACQYDHEAISEGTRDALLQFAHKIPCRNHGACRRADCTYGHLCGQAECKFRGGKHWCSFLASAHNQDLNVARFVDAEDPTSADDQSITASRQSSTPSRELAVEWPNGNATDEKEPSEAALMSFEDDLSSGWKTTGDMPQSAW